MRQRQCAFDDAGSGSRCSLFSDSDYINDLDCYWKFTIDCPLSLQPLIVLQFTRFGTQPPDLLSGFYTDFITLSDSPHHNSSSVQVWAGTDPQYAPGPLSIPRDSLWLHFHSDPSISSYAGFQIRYSFSCMASSSSGSEPTADPGLLTCESSSDIVGQGTYVFSEPSLVSRFECGWRLRNPASASPSCVQPQVQVTLEDVHLNGDSDFLYVFDGPSAEYADLLDLSAESARAGTHTLRSSSASLFVRYSSGFFYVGKQSTFSVTAVHLCGDEARTPTMVCPATQAPLVQTSAVGTVSANNVGLALPARITVPSHQVGNGRACGWVIENLAAPTETCPWPGVVFHFITFSTEFNQDFLYAFDGASDRAMLFGAYSGTSVGLAVPASPVASSQSSVYFEFVTDRSR